MTFSKESICDRLINEQIIQLHPHSTVVIVNHQKSKHIYFILPAVYNIADKRDILIGWLCRPILIIILLSGSAVNWAERPCLAQDGECRGEKTNFLLVNRKFSRAVWSDLSSITPHSSWAGNCGGGGKGGE